MKRILINDASEFSYKRVKISTDHQLIKKLFAAISHGTSRSESVDSEGVITSKSLKSNLPIAG